MKDIPYTIETCGRLIVGKNGDSGGLQRTMVGGVLIGDLIQGECSNYELWDVELTITVRRKHTGSPIRGGTMDTQLVNALNEPDRWDKKIFDTLEENHGRV